jgi:hypothetical protein
MTEGTTDDDYTVPFSMRLTRAQRQRLDMDAGAMTAGHCLFENPTPQKRTFRRPVQDEQALSQLLGALGRGRLSSNLNQIAKAVHSGSLPVSPETEQAILAACAEVADMRAMVVKALGYEALK